MGSKTNRFFFYLIEEMKKDNFQNFIFFVFDSKKSGVKGHEAELMTTEFFIF